MVDNVFVTKLLHACANGNTLHYEATHWERGQFIEFISSREE